jgi:hypothetical protein
MFTNCLSHATVSSHTFFILFSIAAITDSFSQYRDVPLNSSITSVQPMTGIVLWTDNHKNKKDAISLEYSYMLYNSVVKEKGVYDWSSVDALLEKVASRRHQAILRFRFVYPGYKTSVPDYIKSLDDYNETEGESEGETTWFPDWTHKELHGFTLEFYSELAERYDKDPRIAFIQTGFGLWAEYHIYDGPFILGKTFPSKEFQAAFFKHLDTVFVTTPWNISIDAADEKYSPFKQQSDLKSISFGLFDDSFMCEDHSEYNSRCWNFFGPKRYLYSPAGGEFSYYTDYDQKHVLDPQGIHGVSWENACKTFHISYMIGNDQVDYQTMDRIKEAGMAAGYKFRITRFLLSDDSALIEVKNTGVAPIYYDAYVAVGGIRARESLKLLEPDSSIICNFAINKNSLNLTIECDHLVPGQQIEYEANLKETSTVRNTITQKSQKFPSSGRLSLFLPDGRLVYSRNIRSLNKEIFSILRQIHSETLAEGILFYRFESRDQYHHGRVLLTLDNLKNRLSYAY